jgi:hypothetical protein
MEIKLVINPEVLERLYLASKGEYRITEEDKRTIDEYNKTESAMVRILMRDEVRSIEKKARYLECELVLRNPL